MKKLQKCDRNTNTALSAGSPTAFKNFDPVPLSIAPDNIENHNKVTTESGYGLYDIFDAEECKAEEVLLDHISTFLSTQFKNGRRVSHTTGVVCYGLVGWISTVAKMFRVLKHWKGFCLGRDVHRHPRSTPKNE